MQLALILAVLAAVAGTQDVLAEPVRGAGYRLGIALGGMTLVALFAAVASGVTAVGIRRDVRSRLILLRRYRIFRIAHLVLWLATAGLILWGLDWARLVRFNWRLDRVFLLDDILIMAPVVLPIVASWAAFYDVERALRLAADGPGVPAAPMATRRQYLGVHVRHYLGVLLLPLLGLLAAQDAAELWMPGVSESDYALAIYGPSFLLLFLFFPLLLRYLWQTEPLAPGSLRDRLESAAVRSRLAVRRILVWKTGGLLINAAVAGAVAPLRYVFITDGLVARLDEDEIEAVFGHELGHVWHRHLLFRILAMAVPLSLWLLIGQLAPDAARRIGEWFSHAGIGLQVPMGLATVAALGAYMFLVFGFYSRLLEHQADLFACRVAAPGACEQAREAFISALEKLALSGGGGRRAGGWQHASIARRVSFLRRATDDPRNAQRLHRCIRLLNVAMVALVLSPIVGPLLLG